MNQKAKATKSPEEIYAQIHAQRFTFAEFKEHAVITPLENHGRAAAVTFFDRALGFADALGDSGLQAVHRAEVNNALYFNSEQVGWVRDGVPLPAPEALDDYPALRETFPDAAAAVEQTRLMPTADDIAKVVAAGFKVHAGKVADGDLVGRWWWTLAQRGWTGVESAPGDFDTAAHAWADAVRELRENPDLQEEAA